MSDNPPPLDPDELHEAAISLIKALADLTNAIAENIATPEEQKDDE